MKRKTRKKIKNNRFKSDLYNVQIAFSSNIQNDSFF